jgi:hypothetical protein
MKVTEDPYWVRLKATEYQYWLTNIRVEEQKDVPERDKKQSSIHGHLYEDTQN